MMTHEILHLENISKSYGMNTVLNGANLVLNQGERAALVGENGTGKTTLARIILGTENADGGLVRLTTGATIGYLPQEVSAEETISVQHYLEEATGEIASLRDTMQQLEAKMTQDLPSVEMECVLQEYGSVQEQFERRGGYDLDTQIERIFDGLGISYIDPARPLHTLSGGERTRVALTALLLRAPDLLLLDEPTNHLDFAGIEWLEEYLSGYSNAVLLITHDRVFINRVANVIVELHPTQRTLQTYFGTYDDYIAEREREYHTQVDAYNSQQAERKSLQQLIRLQQHNRKTNGRFTNDGDKFLKHFKRGRGEALQSKEIRDAKQRLNVLEEEKMANPRHEWRVEFRFEPQPLPSAEPLRLVNLSKSFGDDRVLDDITATIYNGERVVLVAPNGAGKTTLLRIIMGLDQPDNGKVELTNSAIPGYLDQEGETLDPAMTVQEAYEHVAAGNANEAQAELHRSGLFSDATLLQKRVDALSVGQRRKLGLARIIAAQANLLLLDEPTNHLDPLSLEALEEALIDFPGTILAVSHDRRFVERVATRIWNLEDGKLKEGNM